MESENQEQVVVPSNFSCWEPNMDHQCLPRDVHPHFYHLSLEPDLVNLEFKGTLMIQIEVSIHFFTFNCYIELSYKILILRIHVIYIQHFYVYYIL